MNNIELVKKVLDVAQSRDTVYGWGTFGWPWNQAAMDRVSQQYPSFYTPAKKIQLKAFLGKGYFAFDCVGLIKGLLWGWNGDKSKTYGGAAYATGGVPDIDANVMIARCAGGGSTDFSSIEPGEVVWLQGHIGVYIGDGKAVECTPSWENGTQITAVLNIGSINGLKGRKWTKHGKLPYITYVKDSAPASVAGSNIAIGDTVEFTGSKHYSGSNAVNPSACRPGLARVTAIASGTKHPYHLVKVVGGTSSVYGWVDANAIKTGAPDLAVGDNVIIVGGKYVTGQAVPSWARSGVHNVSRIKDGQALLGADGGINSWMFIADLKKV